MRGRGQLQGGARGAEPADSEREAGPGRGPEEAGQEPEGEADWLLPGAAKGRGQEAVGGVWVLPRPLELKRGKGLNELIKGEGFNEVGGALNGWGLKEEGLCGV